MNQFAPAASILLALALSPWAGARADTPILTFDEVRPGSRGVGRTVFSGTTVETFDVEILGKLPNVSPGRHVILARCSGGPLADTGVLSGMSGSPVTIDGKLIGAIAFSWGFSKEPIAGITPIEEMLALVRSDPGSGTTEAGGVPLTRGHIDALMRPSRAGSWLVREWRRLGGAGTALSPISVPLSVTGVRAAGLDRVRGLLADTGMLPLQSGGSGAAAAPSPAIEPGSAIGLKLIRGDLEMTATGTATWVNGRDVLAFGHPLLGLGEIDLPLTGATVQALLPSLQQSARIATPLSEIGALRQDRASGVLGRLGAEAGMIPVRLDLSGPAREQRLYSFDVADQPLLSPLLLYSAVQGILTSEERTSGNATVRLGEGSVIQLDGSRDVRLDNLFAGSNALEFGSVLPAFILHLIMNNAWGQPRVLAINLRLEYDDVPRTGVIRRAVLDRYRARAGETVRATVVLSTYGDGERLYEREFDIPAETPPGPLTLRFGGAMAIGRSESRDQAPLPSSLDALILLINRLRRNDRIYILATREDTGVLLGGARLPSLPPSALTLLTRPATRGDFVPFRQRAVLEIAIETGHAVGGSATIELDVVAP